MHRVSKSSDFNHSALHFESFVYTHGGKPTVDVAIATPEKVTISGAQVSIEEGVDEGIH